jgi:hypothetical protein
MNVSNNGERLIFITLIIARAQFLSTPALLQSHIDNFRRKVAIVPLMGT